MKPLAAGLLGAVLGAATVTAATPLAHWQIREVMRMARAYKLANQHSIDQAKAVGFTDSQVQYYLGREGCYSQMYFKLGSLLPTNEWPNP